MTGECASVLKQRSMTRVRVDNELGIGQMRAERKRIDGRNHDVVVPVDKYPLLDLLQVSVGLTSGFLPGGHRCEPRGPVAASSGRRTTSTSLDLIPESPWSSNSMKSSTQGLSCPPSLVVLMIVPPKCWQQSCTDDGRRYSLGSLRKFVAEHGQAAL